MSFTKVNPGGWSVGQKLTSAQINQLDTDHANALDKTGDNITGAVGFAGGGQLVTSASSQIVVASANGLVADAAFAVNPNTADAISPSAANAIRSGVAGGISTAVPKGITDGGVAHGISSTTPGGIAFDGGSTDWPVMSPGAGGRTIQIAIPPIPLGPATGWTAAQGCISGPGTTTPIFLAIPRIFPGCEITQVVPYLKVAGPHSSVPTNFPKLEVYKFQLNIAGAPSQLWLNSAHGVSASAGSAGGWDNSGFMQSWLYACNQNQAALDAFATGYYMTLTDENGANSIAGNEYFGFQLTVVVTDMRVC